MPNVKCERCNGSGEVGVGTRGSREVPGPVPEDARGWHAVQCPDCGGEGEIELDDDSYSDSAWDAFGALADHGED